jgi:hypothetical protein
MSAFTFAITASGTADQEDKNAALYAIGVENARRAALDPPVAALPFGTNPEIKSSYQTVLSTVASDIHAHNIAQSNSSVVQQFRTLIPIATDAQRAAALAALQA